MTFEAAQRIADAVLYEGYLLYPYTAASGKNRVRFQFGVVAPQAFSEADPSEYWAMQTECLLEAAPDATIDLRIRFLQLQARTVEAVDPEALGGFSATPALEVDGSDVCSWDEAVERQIDETGRSLVNLLDAEQEVPFAIAGGREIEHVHGPAGAIIGRIVRVRWPIEGVLRLSAERHGELLRLRVRVENRTAVRAELAGREESLRRSLLGCHTLLALRDGSFVSLLDPPAEAVGAVRACTNLHTWPVLVGEEGQRDLVLSSPIILYDYPAIAPESPSDLFDATEIDEILMLRVMTLSDAEKRAARATDPRAKRIIDAADDMPPEIFERLHGAIRYLRETPGTPAIEPTATLPDTTLPPIQPWSPDEPDWPTFGEPKADRLEMPASVWEPDARVAPDRAAIEIAGMTISKGASVRLRPNRRADSMDTFLVGRVATVEAVFESVDDETHVAVTIDDDPATDLHRAYGRFFYFAPDELEPLAPAETGSGQQPVMLEPSARSLAER